LTTTLGSRAFHKLARLANRDFRLEAVTRPEGLFTRLSPAPRLVLLDIQLGPDRPDGSEILRRMRDGGYRGSVFMTGMFGDQTASGTSAEDAVLLEASGSAGMFLISRLLERRGVLDPDSLDPLCDDSPVLAGVTARIDVDPVSML